MRISVNLASRPFVEIRPLLARLRLGMALLGLLAVLLGVWLHSLSARARAARAALDVASGQTLAVQQRRSANEARMRQPQNRAVLDRSHFLNSAFAAKSFSWTAVMMDLERVLPPGVQVTSIDPQISKEGDVTIRLRVSGDRGRAVQLVRNLEHSSRFVAPRLSSETTQATDTAAARQAALTSGTPLAPPGVEFDILSGYEPLPEPPSGTNTSAPQRPTVSSAPPTREDLSGTGGPGRRSHHIASHKPAAAVHGAARP